MKNIKLPRLAYNWISALGMALALISALTLILLLGASFFVEPQSNPYFGIFLYMVLPAVMVSGLLLAKQTLLDAGFAEDALDGSWVPYRPVGCNSCTMGYKGRVGIYQVMPISEEIQRIILADGSALDIAAQAEREGVRSLRQSGLRKVQSGQTSLEEVLAVTNE